MTAKIDPLRIDELLLRWVNDDLSDLERKEILEHCEDHAEFREFVSEWIKSLRRRGP
jgi:hypothetical protein